MIINTEGARMFTLKVSYKDSFEMSKNIQIHISVMHFLADFA